MPAVVIIFIVKGFAYIQIHSEVALLAAYICFKEKYATCVRKGFFSHVI